METSRKDDYSSVAKKASELLKDGVGIIEILNSIRAKYNISNQLRESNIVEKTNK